MVSLKINGIDVSVKEGATVLEAAREAGVNIPTLCYLKEINEIAACRICVVEVKGQEQLLPACATKVWPGMEVLTDSEKVFNARRTNLRLILSQHDSKCPMCIRNGNCTLQKLAKDFNLVTTPYEENIPEKEWPKDAYLVRNESKCIKCMRCIQVCDKIQSVHIWDMVGSGSRTTIGIRSGKPINETECVLCGQCVTHCPTGALTARDDTAKVYAEIHNPDKVTCVQIAPAVRAAWAEELGLSREQATTGRMVAALKKLGFDYVFDTNFSADLTIMEEGNELIGRLKDSKKYAWPMFTSCCPGWVRFIKSQYPEFVPNLSSAKSPQQMFGAVAKSYFAEKKGIDPHKMCVLSVMPCMAKKSECDQPNQIDACGDKDVDFALTTRELSRMIRYANIDLTKLPEEEFDSPLGEGTGAAVIFGATGGVMDAALRTAYFALTGKNPDADAFKNVRGMDGWKEAVFTIPGTGELRVAVASGLANTRRLMDAIKNGEKKYDFVEIMACPGGCAGGGGQPIHDGQELADVRGDILWGIDKNLKVRYSHENTEVAALYKDYMEKPLSEKAHHLLHTDHNGWTMPLAEKK